MTEDRSASFVELFFDLVFVFGITQVVSSIHGHLDWATLWRAAVVLTLLWWAWSQYTWLAGHADFDDFGPRIVILFATAGAFLTAVAVKGAWGSDGPFFGAGYFGVMALGGVFYWVRVRGTDRMQGVLIYTPQMLAGATLVLAGGFVEGDARSWFWIGGVAANLVAALAAGRFEFEISAAHFAERHALFVIIVLGEALIAIGVGTVGQEGTAEFYLAGTAMLGIVLGLWWSYFDWLSQVGDQQLKAATVVQQGRLARDAYTMSHLPLIAGVILFAVGTEELLAHPELVLDEAARWAFLGGLILFFGSQILMAWRLVGRMAWERVGLIVGLAAIGSQLGAVAGVVIVGLVAALVLAVLAAESVRFREQLRSFHQPGALGSNAN